MLNLYHLVPQFTDEHLTQPDASGIRYFTDAGRKLTQQHLDDMNSNPWGGNQ